MSPHSPTQKTERVCPRCGLVFTSERLDGLCPACLLSNTLDEEIHNDDGPAFWEDPPEKKGKAPARTFSHFELLDELGRGGMGVVYRARDLTTERIVALKVLQAHHLDVPDLVQRFRSEVRAVSSLDHPYVLPIHEVGEHEGIPFFSMKLTTGGSLAHSLGTYLGKPKEAAQLLAKVARGVQHAHERGILHRDLKPGNILIDAAGEPYVCDFGLAKWIEDDQKLTVTAAVLGTPHYIAPEQALGSKALTIAVDIYSLGAILYELLTGRPPFVGNTVLETLVASQEKTPDRPSSLAKNVPADLETICLKALEHNPSQRYATAGAFADDLENYIAGRPITARPVNAAEQLWRWAKRNPLPALLVVALFGILIAITFASIFAAARLEKERARAVTAESDATEKLHESYVAQARAALVTGRAGQRVEALAALQQAAKIHATLPVRNESIAALSLLDLKLIKMWPIRQRSRVQPLYDDTLSHVIAEASPGVVRITRLADGATIAEISDPSRTKAIEAIIGWQMKTLAIRYVDGEIVVWDIGAHKQKFSLKVDTQFPNLPWLAYDCAFSPNGDTLFIPTSFGLDTYNSEIGTKKGTYDLTYQPNCLAFSADGSAYATTSSDKPIMSIGSIQSQSAVRIIKLPAPALHVAWSPSGDTLAVAGKDFNIYVIRASDGHTVTKFTGHRQEVTQVRFSNSGDLLASTSRDNTLRLWSLKSNAQEVMAPGFGGMPAIYFSKDDSRLVAGTGDTRACIFEICGKDRICQTIAPQTDVQRSMLVSSIGFSPNLPLCVSVSYENVEVFDPQKGVRLLSAPIDPNVYKAAVFIDGQTLLISSDKSGIMRYHISGPLEHPALDTGSTILGETNYTLGSLSDCPAETATCFRRGRGSVTLLDVKTGRLETITEERSNIKDAFLCSKKGWIALTFFEGAASTFTNTEIWSVSEKRLLRTIPSGPGSRACISPDGKWLATTSLNGCMIWDASSFKLVKHFPSFGYTLTFAPDSSILAVSENEDVMLIDLASQEVVAQLRPPVFASVDHRLAFSPDGSLLAAEGADGTLRLWNIRKLKDELKAMGLGWNHNFSL